MKRFFIEKLMKLAFIAALAVMIFATSCKDEDEPTPVTPVEDGIYVKGAGTALTDFDAKGLLKPTKNEVGQADRAGLYELYIAVEAGADGFNIVKVVGGVPTSFGPGADFAEVLTADKNVEEPGAWFSRGSLAATETKFTVPESGLYHVVYDTDLNTVIVARVNWGIIGAASPLGWGGSTALTSSAFDKNAMSFSKTEVILTVGDYKFRYSDGWKIIIDGELVRVNTNLGGALTALVPGGGNIANAVNGYYTITVNWTLDGGTSAIVTKTGDYTPPSYPAEMYMVGDGTPYGWATPGTVENGIMHKVAGGALNEGIFWKICFLTAETGFKVSAANWGTPNMGFADVTEFDAAGVTVADDGGGNMKVATSGMYMIVLNLRDGGKKLSIIAPEVYGMGDAFGGYTEDVPANLFTIDNTAKTLISPAITVAGNVRMYVNHAWIPSWWQSEFVLVGGLIEYRNDSANDPSAMPGTIGQVVTLHFDDNTGSIAK